MKSSTILALLSYLAGTGTALSLNPTDVPTECDAMCSPIVRLSTLCDVGRLKKRDPQVPQPIPLPSSRSPAPVAVTSPPAAFTLGSGPTPIALPTPVPTPADGTGRGGTSNGGNRGAPGGNGNGFGNGFGAGGFGGGFNPFAAGADRADQLEAQCICLNPSFDVGKIAPLCASCINQNQLTLDKNIPQNQRQGMTGIMSRCSFLSATYAPSATALLRDVTVVASRPAFGPTQGATQNQNRNPSPQPSAQRVTAGAQSARVVASGFALLGSVTCILAFAI